MESAGSVEAREEEKENVSEIVQHLLESTAQRRVVMDLKRAERQRRESRLERCRRTRTGIAQRR